MKQGIFLLLLLCLVFACEAPRAIAQSRSQFLPSEQDSARFMEAGGESDSLWLDEEPPHLQHEREWLRSRREGEQTRDWFEQATQQNAPFPMPNSAMLSGEVIEAASARMDEPGPSEDYIADMIVDQSGNMYITGSSSAGPGIASDYLTVKYNSAGVLQWRASYSGPGNNADQAKTLAVDTSGNVYVTGWSKGTGSASDFATVKYNSAGVQQWAARYDGPTHSQDEARDLAVDAEGNVYLVGRSVGNIIVHNPDYQELDFDFVTIKYDAHGKQEWAVRNNGASGSFDDPQALALDSRGHVYVAGSTWQAGSQEDFILIKYNANGAERWRAYYNGPVDGKDKAVCLAVDNQDNIVVAGTSVLTDFSTGLGIVRYNRHGVRQWMTHYRRFVVQALALDHMRNIYVAGNRYGVTGGVTTTLKFNADGLQHLEVQSASPQLSLESVRGLAVDLTGNVYLAGSTGYASDTSWDFFTIKYDAWGRELWRQRFNTPPAHRDEVYALGLDAENNVYVAGLSKGATSSHDFLLIKYNAAGAQKWLVRHDEPGHFDDRAQRLVADEAGNIYVAGYSSGYDNSRHALVVKYDPNCVEQWRARVEDMNWVAGLAVDAGGNAYCTGYGPNAAGDQDYLTFKLNATGQRQWLARLHDQRDDYATALALDNRGNVYVTGYVFNRSFDKVAGSDYFTVKYSSQGIEQWRARYDGPAHRGDYAVDLAIDRQNHVYVTGYSFNRATVYDYVTIKYDDTGREQWVAKSGVNDDVARALKLDEAGNIYVTGYTTGRDFLTIKYHPNGTEQWAAKYHAPNYSINEPNAMAVDRYGSVYVTGYSVSGGNFDFTTVKYNASGGLQWARQYGYSRPVGKPDEGKALTVDQRGNVYVAGLSTVSSGYDFMTIKYNAAGDDSWWAQYNAPSNGDDVANGIIVDAAGNVYVAGRSFSKKNSSDFLTLKYSQPNYCNVASGWSVQHIVDADDVVLGFDQGARAGAAPRENLSLALSADEKHLYLGYAWPPNKRLVRKIALGVSDPARNHNAVVAQLHLRPDKPPVRDIATDDRGRVYLALGERVKIYNADLAAPALHIISGFSSCEGVTTRRERGQLVLYATDRLARTLSRFELSEGANDSIIASNKTGWGGNGEIKIHGAKSPRGLAVTAAGIIWIADLLNQKIYRMNAASGAMLDSTSVKSPIAVALDESRGEAYVSQHTHRKLAVLNLADGKLKHTLAPPEEELQIDLAGAEGNGALHGIAVASCNRVYVANTSGRSRLVGNPADSPFSNVGDDHARRVADAEPVLLVSGEALGKGVVEEEEEVASEQLSVTSYELAQNYPNPFNPETQIAFAMPKAGEVRLRIYSIAGELVRTLAQGKFASGKHEIHWDGRNKNGELVAAGVYLYRVIVTGADGQTLFTQTKRMALVK